MFSKCPFTPGSEPPYYDDTTPNGLLREDYVTATGNQLTGYFHKGQQYSAKTIFYVHGGGFVRGNEAMNRATAIVLATRLGLPAYCCKYRYAPEHKYPAGLDDVEIAWNYLTHERAIPPEQIILVGDSAGGNYAMAFNGSPEKQGLRSARKPCGVLGLHRPGRHGRLHRLQ